MSIQNMTRPQRALQAAQQAARKIAADRAADMIQALKDWPGVAFVSIQEGFFDFTPTPDIATRMVLGEQYSDTIDEGHLIWCLDRDQLLPASLTSAERAVEECFAMLNASGERFAMITHIEGDSKPRFEFAGYSWSEALGELRVRLGDTITYWI